LYAVHNLKISSHLADIRCKCHYRFMWW